MSVLIAVGVAFSKHAQTVHFVALYVVLAAAVLTMFELRRAGISQLLTREPWELLAGEIRSPPMVAREGKISVLLHVKSFAPYPNPRPELEAVLELGHRYETCRQGLEHVKPDGTWALFRVDHEISMARYPQFCGTVPATRYMPVNIKVYVKGTDNLVLDSTLIGEVEGQAIKVCAVGDDEK
jgi:hypothetical protein